MKLTIEGTLLEILAVVGGDINIEQDNLDPAPGHPELPLEDYALRTPAEAHEAYQTATTEIPEHLPKPPLLDDPAKEAVRRGYGWRSEKKCDYMWYSDGEWNYEADTHSGGDLDLLYYEIVDRSEPVAGLSDEELGEKLFRKWQNIPHLRPEALKEFGAYARALLTGKGGVL